MCLTLWQDPQAESGKAIPLVPGVLRARDTAQPSVACVALGI